MNDTGGTKQGQPPRRPTPMDRNLKSNIHVLSSQVIPRKIAPLELKTLKEKDATEVVHKLHEGLDRLDFLLRSDQDRHSNDDFVFDLVCTLAVACRTSQGEKTNQILGVLKGSHFLSTKVARLLQRVEASVALNDTNSKRRLIDSLIVVFSKYLTHLPSSYGDLPYEKLKLALDQSGIERKEDLEKKLDAFKQARDDIIRGERQKRGRDGAHKAGEKPPNNFRDMTICPTNREIKSQEKPFLRKNISEGRYENAEHYLDVQFRLLREDFLEPLRKGIFELVHNVPKKQRKQLIRYYRGVQIMKKKFTWSGITYEVQIDVSGVDTSRWAQSKRLLFGSFLCLSNDNFETMLFATVSNHERKDLRKGTVDVRFIQGQDVFEIEERQQQYLMVESPAYFEAYRHVLKGLKDLNEDTLPFKKYLVECSSNVEPPEYLRRHEDEVPVHYNFTSIASSPFARNTTQVPVLQLETWPSADALHLNSSQLAALKTAITTEFTVIQGPPGTGKTYVGAKIVQCLLSNREQWNPERNSPMLMVCYTNHALDQFLEKVLDFLPADEIVRVGAGCKSKSLEQCSIKLFTKRYRRYDGRSTIEENRTENERQLEDCIAKVNQTVLEFNDLEDRIDPRLTDQLYNAIFPANATTKCQTINNTFRLWLCNNRHLNIMNQTRSKKRRKTGESKESNLLGNDEEEKGVTFLCKPAATGLVVCDLAVASDDLSNDDIPGANSLGEKKKSPPSEKEANVSFKAGKLQAEKVVRRRTNLECVADSSFEQNNPDNNHLNTGEQEANFADSTVRLEPSSEWLGTANENCDVISNLSPADEETIAVDEEATLIQNQRCMDGDEEYMSEIPKLSTKGTGSQRNHEDGIDEDNEWREVTYRQTFKPFVWQDNNTRESGGLQLLRNENQGKDSDQGDKEKSSRNRGKERSRIHLTAYTKVLKPQLEKETMMPSDEVMKVSNIWDLQQKDRLRLYLYWVQCYRERCKENIRAYERRYEELCGELLKVKEEEEEIAIRRATVVGMTTSGAAKCHSMLQRVAPKIVIVEEAAEVMEAHIITSLSRNTKHTILIGDHKQLRPKATVYKLAQDYKLGISLFERMVMNKMECKRLSTQHRMRPEIAALTKRIYDHEIIDHDSVYYFDDISGVSHNLFFIDHCEPEKEEYGLQSFSNPHEAGFLVAFCHHLLLQGYKPEQITVLTMYTGQLLELKNRMPKKAFEGVRVCVVDNFQGEENDIILLSLVRSNIDIGFLKESNRICVALSRARQGFYCIGNFNLLKGKCNLWKEICDDLESKNAIGRALTLVCKRHRRTNEVHSSTQFQIFPLGGCDKMCGERLDCGHACNRPCHPTDEYHQPGKCPKECLRTCPNEHQCSKTCHYPQGCFCALPVVKTIPRCGHSQTLQCCIEPEDHLCKAKCERILNCGHECKELCGNQCTSVCKVDCNKTLPCGHEKIMSCFKSPANYTGCKMNCNKVLQCGHPCSKRCKDRCQCNTTVTVELNCKHRLQVLCREKFNLPLCIERCGRKLDCGHACPRPCREDCSAYPCEILISKVLPCGHTQRIPCHFDTKSVVCEEFCQKRCEKGHPCEQRCHFDSPCKECNVVVYKPVPACKHTIKTLCHVDPATLVCKMPCERYRICGHPCRDFCGRKCEARNCMKLVPKTLPCNHTVTLACHKDPQMYNCKENVVVELACGHKKKTECYTKKDCLKYFFCKERVQKELSCKHKITLPCHKTLDDYKCKIKVEVPLACGHTKRVICSTLKEGLQSTLCTVKVKRTLPCQHDAILPCCKKIEEYICQEEVVVGLPCGHTKSLECSRARNLSEEQACHVKVTKSLPCGHEKEVRCFVKAEEVLCDAPCERQHPTCNHPCRGRCSDVCSTLKCTEQVSKNLPCGHTFSCRCSDDVSQIICPNKCKRKLSCGHKCTGKCSEKCRQDKCKIMVVKKLQCQGKHTRRMPCHKGPDKIVCQKRCKRKLECGHPCQGLCGELCGDQRCTRTIENVFSCGHKASFSCFQRHTAICTAPCQKRKSCKHLCEGLCGEPCSKYPCNVLVTKTLPCGHKSELRCSDDPQYVQCLDVCGANLQCGHQCSGICNECMQRTSHEMCQRPCNRILICLHRCKATCSEPCPPCYRNCIRLCPHDKCKKRCSQPCEPCMQPCMWSCKHYQCNNLCGEYVSHRCPYDAHCSEKLICGHPCIGLCGENCPSVCVVCQPKNLSTMLGDGQSKQTEATRYLQLFDCGHIVTVEEMDSWMARDLGNDVQLHRCPRCSTAITFSYRYGDVIKRTTKAIDDVHAEIDARKFEVRDSVCNLTKQLTKLNYPVNNVKFPRLIIPKRQHHWESHFRLNAYSIQGRYVPYVTSRSFY